MAESSGEKSEQPTPKKLRDAREKGQVAKSQDLSMGLLFLVLGSVVLLSGGRTISLLEDSMRSHIARALTETPMTPDFAFKLLLGAEKTLFQVIGSLLAVAFLFGAVVVFAQVGPLLTTKTIEAKPEKLNPVSGFRQRFFSAQTYIELAKSILKIVIVGVFVYAALKGSVRDIALTVRQSLPRSQELTAALLQTLVFRVGFGFIALGTIDVFIQRWQHIKKLRMSRDDVQREHKQQEGDPQYKGERQRMHREILQHSMVEDVKNADVVIVDPTHLAIALRYEKGEMGAPQVTAKGERLVAEQIREVAERYKVPILRNVPLAHALIQLEIGDQVPEDLYTVVAEVLQWVYEQREEKNR